MLDFVHAKPDCCLVIDGGSLQVRFPTTIIDLEMCLDEFRTEFVALATQLPAVVACRCSPTQKADVARLIRDFSQKTVCCIGDGGNDVSMIQAANVGEFSTITLHSDDRRRHCGQRREAGVAGRRLFDYSIFLFGHLATLAWPQFV